MPGQIKVTQKKSGIGRPEYFTTVLKGLGLTRLNQTVVLQDTRRFAE
jgi:large subunit ribosomal protein L30